MIVASEYACSEAIAPAHSILFMLVGMHYCR